MTLCGSHDGECPDPKSARPKDTVPSLLNEELQKLDKRAGSDAAMIYALHLHCSQGPTLIFPLLKIALLHQDSPCS